MILTILYCQNSQMSWDGPKDMILGPTDVEKIVDFILSSAF